MMKDDFDNQLNTDDDDRAINSQSSDTASAKETDVHSVSEDFRVEDEWHTAPEQMSQSETAGQPKTSSEGSVYRYSRDQIHSAESTRSAGSAYSHSGSYQQNGAYHSGYNTGSGYGSQAGPSGSGYGSQAGPSGSSYGSQAGPSGSSYGSQAGPSGSSYGSQAGPSGSGYNHTSGYDTGRNPYYQNYQRSAEPVPPKKTKRPKKSKKMNGWLKVICYALVFGIIAGTVMEGIHWIGSSLRSDASAETAQNENVIDVVKVSSENVQTYEAEDVSDIVEEVMPSVVSVNTIVETTTQDFFGRVYSQEGEGAGSGFIFSQDDDNMYIVTNYHVIEDSKSITVTFNDGSTATAAIKGYVEDEDIAVLTIAFSELSEETKQSVKAAVIGDSSALKAGNGAIAIGNALGYGQSVTTGAISAVERQVQLTDGEMTLIQTSAAINPGNSGGPLLNAKGEVIGINTVKYSETTVEGMGFAIPMDSAMETINDIISGKIVNKSDSDSVYFGIKGGTVTADLAEQIGCPQGVYVSYVYSGSAAQRAGLQQGYIITAFDGTEITTIEELQECLTNYAPGDSVTLEVCTTDRSGNYTVTQTLSTILGSRAEAPEEY